MTGTSRFAIAADSVFDGRDLLEDRAILIEGTRIISVMPPSELPEGIECETLPSGAWLAPGFIDTQVNGGGDVLFNDAPTQETIEAIAAAHRWFGTTAFLPTLITDTDEKMRAALDAVSCSRVVNPSVLGIHFEGPFLSPQKPGVHDTALIRRPTDDDEALLTSLTDGVTLVTLAPECVPQNFVVRLAAHGVKVSLGHSMATYAETKRALTDGLTGFTHLFNAMRPLGSRDPGPVAAALETDGAWFGMIVDGAHVDPAVLRLALRGAASPMLVTDAMPPVGGSKSTFMLGNEEITVRDGICTRTDGALAGAALDMESAVRNCVALLGVKLIDALRFASTEPARFLGLGDELGRLAPGFRADLVALEPGDIRILKTWVAGRA